MRIFITGICGFVGSTLALRLRERIPDARISGMDSLIRLGSQTNRPVLQAAGIKVIHGDVRCASDFETLPDCDWIIDAAANASVLAGVDGRTSSRQLVEHNLIGTVNLLEFARRTAAGVVLLSSSRCYNIPALAEMPCQVKDEAFFLDTGGKLPKGLSEYGVSEEFSTAPPVSLYGATKLASEVMALEYGQAFGFPVVVNRCGVLAGAGQFGVAEQGIFSFWIRAYALRKPLRYLGFDGTGHQVRDALHPDDLAELMLRQMEQPQRSAGTLWNVGGGPENAISLAQLSRWCGEQFGVHSVVADGRPRPFDVPWMVMDSRRVSAAFGWKSRVGLHDILGEIASHHRQHPEWFDLSQSS